MNKMIFLRKMEAEDISFLKSQLNKRYRNEPDFSITVTSDSLVARFGSVGVSLLVDFKEYVKFESDDFFVMSDFVKILVDNYDEDEDMRDNFLTPAI